ncbi:hypothetical protein SXCC_04445 [Gluconacetobacter sp. SXCC-1]|nr:hypothetical protein SXCC_04445 [Gluconacetobacter sp. SXCC-1]
MTLFEKSFTKNFFHFPACYAGRAGDHSADRAVVIPCRRAGRKNA